MMKKRRYKEGEIIGEGSFGKVKYEDGYANKHMKNIDTDNGVDSYILREISALRQLQHENIIQLSDILYDEMNHPQTIKFECCDFDLKSFLRTYHLNGVSSKKLRKNIFLDVSKGLNYIHSHKFLHRDLKPQNILLNIESKDAVKVKIGDLGLVKKILVQNFTPTIVTLWYRCPEILLNTSSNKSFDAPSIDIWSLGLIFMEVMTNQPTLKGDSEIGQLMQIFKLFGTPSEEKFPKFFSCEHYTPLFPKMKPKFEPYLSDIKHSTQIERELIKSMLKYDHRQRTSCSSIIQTLTTDEESPPVVDIN